MWKPKITSHKVECYRAALNTLSKTLFRRIPPVQYSQPAEEVTVRELIPQRMAEIFQKTQLLQVDGVELYTLEYVLDQKDEWILQLMEMLGWGGRSKVDSITIELLWKLFVTLHFRSLHNAEVTRYLLNASFDTLVSLSHSSFKLPGKDYSHSELIYLAVTGTTERSSEEVPSDRVPLMGILHPLAEKSIVRCVLRVHQSSEEDMRLSWYLDENYPVVNVTSPFTILSEEQGSLKDWLITLVAQYTSSVDEKGLYTNNVEELSRSLGMIFPSSVQTLPEKTKYFFDNLLAYSETFNRTPQKDPLPPFRPLEPGEYCRYSDVDLVHLFGLPDTQWYSRWDLICALQKRPYRPEILRK